MSNNIIKIQSPTRVDLAGGTLDLWPLYCFLGSAVTVNIAIDIYTQVVLQESDLVSIESEDLAVKKSYNTVKDFLQDPDPTLSLLKSQVHFWQPQKNFTLKTSSQSPVGGGLGGSSSLTISLLKAFSVFCKKDLGDVHKNVHVAHNIEAQVLNTPTGTQDYYPAFSGGLNILNYTMGGIQQKVLSAGTLGLSDHFMLVHTGKSHHSGLNNFEVFKRAVVKDKNTMRCLHELSEISKNVASVCENNNASALPDLFRQEYSA
ncbi:MAG: galactokinase, partial [Pseudobdellovibrionaceae bacterium]